MKRLLFLGTCVMLGLGCHVVLGIEEGHSWCDGKPKGTPLPTSEQTVGDCIEIVCGENGEVVTNIVEADIPYDDGEACTVETCNGSLPSRDLPSAVPCYGGPFGTEDVGQCKPGIMQCASGKPVEPDPAKRCVGQILPVPETCATVGDDDCDGLVNEDGAGCSCQPGTTQSCYSGPTTTIDVGACKAGVQACDDSGLGYGECVGERVPQPDVCDPNRQDENCDGIVECTGQTLVVKSFSASNGGENLLDLAVDSSGNVILLGSYSGELDLGGTKLPPGPNGSALFLAKLSRSGNVLWARALPITMIDSAAITVNTFGEIYVAIGIGIYGIGAAPDIVIDGLTLSGGGAQVYTALLKLSGSTGNAIFAHSSEGPGTYVSPLKVAFNSQLGWLLVNGYSEGAANWESNGALPTGYFFLGMNASNGALAYKVAGSASSSLGTFGGFAVGQGMFSGSFDSGGGVLTSAGGLDIFVVSRSTSSGAHLASAQFGGTDNDYASMAVAGSKRWLAGYTAGTINFGGENLTAVDKSDAFLAVLDDKNTHLFSQMFPGMNRQEVTGISVDSGNNATIVGTFAGMIDFGGTILTTMASNAMFVASFGGDYKVRWARSFSPSVGGSSPYRIAADPTGAIWISGLFTGVMDFGTGLISAGNNNIFLLKLAP